jgi:HAD superfamily phosphatase
VKDVGGGIWATGEALRRVGEVDTIIFDVDGVLLDVSHSFRVCISKTVQHYLEQVLQWSGDGQYMFPHESELFKRAGGFNSDWTLTEAAALLFLAKGVDTCDRRAATLRETSPTLEEYTAEIGKRGGGMDAGLEVLRERIAPDTMERALELWDRDLITRIHCEYYAGRSHCQRVYGFEPEYVDEETGQLVLEKVLIDTSLLPEGYHYGIVTGRNRGELGVALEVTGLEEAIHPERTMTHDEGFHKPDPGGLVALAESMKHGPAVFVGDTVDDLRTVLNYRKERQEPFFLACQVLTGPAGEKNRQFFADEGADVIAPDVNALLKWLTEMKRQA